MKSNSLIQKGLATALILGVPVVAMLVLMQSGTSTLAGEAAMIDAANADLLAAGPTVMPTESLSNWQYTGFWSWIWVWKRVRIGLIWRWIQEKKSVWRRR